MHLSVTTVFASWICSASACGSIVIGAVRCSLLAGFVGALVRADALASALPPVAISVSVLLHETSVCAKSSVAMSTSFVSYRRHCATLYNYKGPLGEAAFDAVLGRCVARAVCL